MMLRAMVDLGAFASAVGFTEAPGWTPSGPGLETTPQPVIETPVPEPMTCGQYAQWVCPGSADPFMERGHCLLGGAPSLFVHVCTWDLCCAGGRDTPTPPTTSRPGLATTPQPVTETPEPLGLSTCRQYAELRCPQEALRPGLESIACLEQTVPHVSSPVCSGALCCAGGETPTPPTTSGPGVETTPRTPEPLLTTCEQYAQRVCPQSAGPFTEKGLCVPKHNPLIFAPVCTWDLCCTGGRDTPAPPTSAPETKTPAVVSGFTCRDWGAHNCVGTELKEFAERYVCGETWRDCTQPLCCRKKGTAPSKEFTCAGWGVASCASGELRAHASRIVCGTAPSMCYESLCCAAPGRH